MTALMRDVTLRDGLQLTGGLLPTARKVQIVRELLRLGMPALEIGSMARADLVPSMANTLEVIAALNADELEKCWIWVATPGHVAKAIAAGARNVQYCLSVSDAHNLANVGRTAEQSMAGIAEALELAAAASVALQLCLATSFTCPFDGPVNPDRVIELATDPRATGAADVVICDTLGQASPAQVSSLIARVKVEVPQMGIAFHGHDTWGMGVANSLAAIDAGARMVDGALAGLGGCPFAPGASGNTGTEDLAFATQPEWLVPSVFHELVRLGESITTELHEGNRSRAAQGARSSASRFEWVIPES